MAGELVSMLSCLLLAGWLAGLAGWLAGWLAGLACLLAGWLAKHVVWSNLWFMCTCFCLPGTLLAGKTRALEPSVGHFHVFLHAWDASGAHFHVFSGC